MTTIAYKDRIIAYDSRICSDNTISDDSFEKRIIRDNVSFFMCGSICDYDLFIEAYFSENFKASRLVNVGAFIVSDGVLYEGSFAEDGFFWKSKLRLNNFHAIGTGVDHALTAMDMGASAKEAIKWAMKRDCKTGGRIRIYFLQREKKDQ